MDRYVELCWGEWPLPEIGFLSTLFPSSTPAGGMEVVGRDRGMSGHGGKVVGWQGMAWRVSEVWTRSGEGWRA